MEDGGQGIVSGFRDAMALAWRLKVGCNRRAHEQLFRAWYLERKQQLESSLAATVENGRYVTERNAFRILVRDTYLALLQLVPPWKRWLEQGQRRGNGGRSPCETRDGGVMRLMQEHLCHPLYVASANGKIVGEILS